MKSCFRYPGGKSKPNIQKLILEYMPPYTREYREAFVGGGGIFFGLSPTPTEIRWINDINPHLIEVYRAFRDRGDQFLRACREILPEQPNEPEVSTKTEAGAKYNQRLGEVFKVFAQDNKMDQALRYFFINRTVWAGRVNYNPEFKSRLYYSNPSGWNITVKPGFLESVVRHMQNTTITCGPYQTLLFASGSSVWVYLDPPYLVDTEFDKGSKLYEFGFSKKQHEQFAEDCANSPHNLAISYDDQPFIRDLFKDKKFRIYEHEWTYSGSSQEKKTVGKELIITNYERPESKDIFDSV